MSLPVVLDAEFCARLALTLAHFLWEGAVIALSAALVSLALRKASSRARYAVWVGALTLMALSLPMTYGLLEPPTAAPETITAAVVEQPEAVESESSRPVPIVESSNIEAAGSTMPESHPASVDRQIDWRAYAPYVVWAYLAGVAAMLLRVALAMGGGRRLRRRSEPVDDPALLESLARQAKTLGLRFTPAAAYCRRIAVPTVVGVIKPAILLPLSLMSGLTPQQIDLLLLHELTHIRRYDPLVNVLQRIVEALLFFHPAVWFVSSRIRVEREHCCDDLVAAHGGAHAYAESLVVAAALAHGVRPSAVGGVAAFDRTSQLRKRVARLLGASEPRVRLMRGGWLLAVLAAPLLAVVIANAAAPDTAAPETPVPGAAVTEPAYAEAIEQLKDEDWWLRQVAVQQLGESLKPEAVTPLIGALKDKDPRVQIAAAQALGRLGQPKAIKHLVAALKEPSGELQKAAAEALMRWPVEDVMPLVNLAAQDKDINVLRGAVVAVGTLNPPNALETLMSMLPRVAKEAKDASELPVREEALALMSDAMGKIDRAEVLRVLNDSAQASDPSQRYAVAHVLFTKPIAGMEPVVRTLSLDPALGDQVLSIVHSYLVAQNEPAPELIEALQTLASPQDVAMRAKVIVATGEMLAARQEKGVSLSAGLLGILQNALKDDRAAIMGIAAHALTTVNWQAPTQADDAWLRVASVADTQPNPNGVVFRRAVRGGANTEHADNMWRTTLAPLGQDAVMPLQHALQADITPLEGFTDGNLAMLHGVAAYALGELRAVQAVPALTNVLAEPGTALCAAKALGEIGDAAAVEPLCAALRGPVPEERIAAVEALGKLKDPRAVQPLLNALAQEQIDDVKGYVAGALIAIGDASAVPGLSNLLSDKDPNTRIIALNVLAGLKDRSAVPAIVEMLKTAQPINVASRAVNALNEIGDPAAVDSLVNLAAIEGENSETEDVREESVAALGRLGDAGAAALIRILGQDQNEKVRAKAARQLGDMGSVAALTALSDAVRLDPSGDVSGEAARALGRIADPAAVKALVDAMTGPASNWHRWDAIIEGLSLSKEPSSTEAMAQLLNNQVIVNRAELQLMLAEKLVDRDDMRAKPVLEKLSENPATRIGAQQLLARLVGTPPVAEAPSAPAPAPEPAAPEAEKPAEPEGAATSEPKAADGQETKP